MTPDDRLLLSPQAAEDLAACADGASPTEELVQAGVVVDGAVDPRLAPWLAAVARPVAVVRAQLRTAEGPEVLQAWLRPEASAALLPRGALVEPLVLGADLVPALLARAVGVRPRPLPNLPPCTVPLAAVDGLLDGEGADALAAALPTAWVGWAGALSSGAWRAAAVVSSWPGELQGGRALSVLVSPQGLVRVQPDGEQAALRPTTPTQVFRDLVRLLPSDAEVAGAL